VLAFFSIADLKLNGFID